MRLLRRRTTAIPHSTIGPLSDVCCPFAARQAGQRTASYFMADAGSRCSASPPVQLGRTRRRPKALRARGRPGRTRPPRCRLRRSGRRRSHSPRSVGPGAQPTSARERPRTRPSSRTPPAPPSAPGSRSTSPRIRCATQPRRGSARKSAIHASSPSTSAMPTSQPSHATPTWTARSSSPPRVGWSSSPFPEPNRRRHSIPSRAVTLTRISPLHPKRPKTAPKTHRPSQNSRVVVVGDVAGGAVAVERSWCRITAALRHAVAASSSLGSGPARAIPSRRSSSTTGGRSRRSRRTSAAETSESATWLPVQA